MTDQPTPLDQMLAIYGMNAGHGQYGPSQVDLNGPGEPDWHALASQYSLSPAEIAQLQIPAAPQGPTIQQRLEALRPHIGQLGLTTNGRNQVGVRGKIPF